ncbi:MAG: ABC transporter ATP-binding protein [Brevefilum sp.]|jgi:ATP-binding cassette subfamily B multidrug efflux pump
MSNNHQNSNSKIEKQPSQSQPPIRLGRGGGPGVMMPGEKARNFKGTIKQLVGYLGKYNWVILVVMLLAAASTVFTIIGPKLQGKATTLIFEGVANRISGDGSGIDFAAISAILVQVLILYVISAFLSFIQGYIMSGVSMDITYRLRQDIATKINRLPLQYFDRISQGEVLSRVTNDVDTVSQTLNQSMTQIITSTATVIGVFIMMLSISWSMTIVATLTIPLSILVIRFVVNTSQKYFRRQQEYLGHVNGHVEEMFGGHIVIKAFNAEEKSVQTFNNLNEILFNSAWLAQFLSHMMMPLMRFISNLGYVAVAILGGYLAITETISVGDIQAFIQYVRNFNMPLQNIANISNVLQQTAAAAERVFEFLNEDEEIPETENPVKLNTVEGKVEFQNVRFGYNPEEIIIKDFSFTARPGQKIAIVGPTGAGKTTLVKLLMRFYDVDGGAILVDEHNIKNYTREDLREMFAMVLQDTWLYNGSIADNIRYGREGANEEEVCKAASMAHVDHFIRTLPGGYSMILNEDASNISSGQKQLITIARAILANPSILILDEATSSVDTRTEVLIQEAMDRLMFGRTSFIIAHRLSTIRNADLILVIHDGDIVEQGNHEDLLEKKGFYADLYYSQFEMQPA